jgi:hypothetical protein
MRIFFVKPILILNPFFLIFSIIFFFLWVFVDGIGPSPVLHEDLVLLDGGWSHNGSSGGPDFTAQEEEGEKVDGRSRSRTICRVALGHPA